MDEAKKEERRRILAELEGSWDTVEPATPPESVGPPPSSRAPVPAPEVQAAFDAAADRLVESLHPPPVSVRDTSELDDLDSGWGEDEEDEEEDEEPEPELPDERLDPVAYAEAKKAQTERMEARRERKRLRAEAKKARRKARMDAAKSKQKSKSKKARGAGSTQAAKVAQAKARGPEAIAKSRTKGIITRAQLEASEAGDAEDTATVTARARAASTGASRARSRQALAKEEAEPRTPASPLAKPSVFSGKNLWVLGIVAAVFIAAAIFAAVVSR